MPITGRCHCERTAFEIDAGLPDRLTRCTCSFCAKRGALWAYYEPRQFRLTTPRRGPCHLPLEDEAGRPPLLPHCGCGTFSDTPAFQPDGSRDGRNRRIGVNARLLDDFDAAEAPVDVIDGKNLW